MFCRGTSVTPLAFALFIGCAPTVPEEHVGTALFAIGGSDSKVSVAAEDFAVFLTNSATTERCAAVLVAPNLALTARHCVVVTDMERNASLTQVCNPVTGEPEPGSGGYVVDEKPQDDFRVYPGVGAAGDALAGRGSPSRVTRILDDGAQNLCSHDLAMIVIDPPLTNVPLARLRLHALPSREKDLVSMSGWGHANDGKAYPNRLKVDGRSIQAVAGDGVGAYPRTFLTGAGACIGDSGGPVFVTGSDTVLGVIVRADNVSNDELYTGGCQGEGVTNVHMLIASFGKLLHDGFAAANALPLREGASAPGWVAFGADCGLDAECESNVCFAAPGAPAPTCNLDCSKPGATCPAGSNLVCGAASKRCVPATASDAGVPSEEPANQPRPVQTDCSVHPSAFGDDGRVVVAMALALTFLVGLRRTVLRLRKA